VEINVKDDMKTSQNDSWFTILTPSPLLHIFHTELEMAHVMRMCGVDSSSLPHIGHHSK